VECASDTLSVPEEMLPLERIGRPKVRIIALVDPVTEVLRLMYYVVSLCKVVHEADYNRMQK